jgi:ABC-type taurine transport system substrate-binding protein
MNKNKLRRTHFQSNAKIGKLLQTPSTDPAARFTKYRAKRNGWAQNQAQAAKMVCAVGVSMQRYAKIMPRLPANQHQFLTIPLGYGCCYRRVA